MGDGDRCRPVRIRALEQSVLNLSCEGVGVRNYWRYGGCYINGGTSELLTYLRGVVFTSF